MKYTPHLAKFLAFMVIILLMTSASATPNDTTAIIDSSSPVSNSVNNIVLIVTLVSSLLTILTVAIQSIKTKSKASSTNQKTPYEKLQENYTEMEKKIKPLIDDNLSEKVKNIQSNIRALDNIVSDLVKTKITTISDNVLKLDQKVGDLNKYFDSALADRKDENKQIKQEINTLRENIREDINDVKGIIMKLMLALKTDDE